MLLDQKKTRRMVVIVSIVSAVGFVGVLPVVLGLVVFGGGNGNQQDRAISDAEKRVQQAPNQVLPLVDLAAQYRAAGRAQDQVNTLRKAVAVGPRNGDELQALVGALADQPAQQLSVLSDYTKNHPTDADAFFTYGAAAERSGSNLTARLAYQQAAKLAPKGSTLRENAQSALDRLRSAPAAPGPGGPGQPVTPATPVTP